MTPSKKQIFDTLNTTTHRVNENISPSLFPDTNPTETNNTEFWYYSDLYNLFGTPRFDISNAREHTYQSFDFSPTGKREQFDFIHQHRQIIQRKYSITSPHTPFGQISKPGTDIKLTRYACWCIFNQHPSLIFTQTYFMNPETDFQTLYKISYEFARVYQRKRYKEVEKQLSGILNKIDANIALFKSHLDKVFYLGRTHDELRHAYNLPKQNGVPLADHMGAISLHARRTAIERAIEKFQTCPIRTFRAFAYIAQEEIHNARMKMISEYKIAPERDIYKKTVSTVASELKQMQKNFIKKYAYQDIRGK